MIFYFRMDFASNFLSEVARNSDYALKVIWTDEAGFNLDGHGNVQNTRYWSASNPDFTVESRMKSHTLHVWAGIWSGGVIGPFFFTGTINGARYLKMLEDEIMPEIEAIPNHQELFYMQDGASPHYALIVRDFLNRQFPDRWIGRGGPIAWPPRSPDLTPMDFSVWGVIKDRAYAARPGSIQELRQLIIDEFGKLEADYCQRCCENVVTRLLKCTRLNGVQIERHEPRV